MSKPFFAIMVMCFGCVVEAPYMDLTQPIYLVAEESFFSGCEDHSDGLEACQQERIGEVEKGVGGWFKHFAEPTRPQVFIVMSRADVPNNAQNTPIHLRIEKDFCAQVACYYNDWGVEPSIVFNNRGALFPIMASHEFGHALWLGHDVPEGRRSVMTPTPSA